MQQLSRQEFARREDALTALKQWQKNLDWHELEDQQVVKKCHYSHRGKPPLQEQPTRRSYSVFHCAEVQKLYHFSKVMTDLVDYSKAQFRSRTGIALLDVSHDY